MSEFRIERDFLGEKQIPKEVLWGIHTARAMENFSISGRPLPKELIHAFGEVKLACARVNLRLGALPKDIGEAICRASEEVSRGEWDVHIPLDAYQGGAGTSTNLCISEVIANRALVILDKKPGEYGVCDPFLHVNLHQSTNDTYPTALKVAVIRSLGLLEKTVTLLQEACQKKETEFAQVVKLGRTELMDAVPMTLGRTFGAWAEVLTRDRWRLFKANERLRVINLGGTAIGTGLGVPRDYIFQVSEELRTLTGLPLARAENLLDNTQNQDVFVETMGLVKTHALNLLKISGDLRLLNMGPEAGLAEIELPRLQAGSSIMPGKVNPVIPELMAMVAMQIAGFDQSISWAAASGQLELNAFLPLIALDLLESLELLTRLDQLVAEKCIAGIQAQVLQCKDWADRSSALATVLVPLIGYHRATEVAELMRGERCSLEQAAERIAQLTPETVRALLTPEALNRLGSTSTPTKPE